MLVDTKIPFLLVDTNCLAPLFSVKQDMASRQLQVSHDDRCTDDTGGGIRIVLFPGGINDNAVCVAVFINFAHYTNVIPLS
jgi:hypothetical protein